MLSSSFSARLRKECETVRHCRYSRHTNTSHEHNMYNHSTARLRSLFVRLTHGGKVPTRSGYGETCADFAKRTKLYDRVIMITDAIPFLGRAEIIYCAVVAQLPNCMPRQSSCLYLAVFYSLSMYADASEFLSMCASATQVACFSRLLSMNADASECSPLHVRRRFWSASAWSLVVLSMYADACETLPSRRRFRTPTLPSGV